MKIRDLIKFYSSEIDKLSREQKRLFVDDFESEWTAALYQEFIQKLKELDEYNQKK